MAEKKYASTAAITALWAKIKTLVLNARSDWEEDVTTDSSYILNKPSIRAGKGENSIVEGYKNDSAQKHTIAVTGDANATEFTFVTEDTLSSSLAKRYVAEYISDDNVLSYIGVTSIDTSNNTIIFESKLSSEALSAETVYLYYQYGEAFGEGSHVEGMNSMASGAKAHAEGGATIALGINSHAEGALTTAYGSTSHAEGTNTSAEGARSHAEGQNTIASGMRSHAEGFNSIASAVNSHAEGTGTIASSGSQHAQGRFNIEDANDTYIDIVGNGSSLSSRSNAYTLDWSGNGWYAGKVTVGTAPTADMDVATKKYVDDSTSGISTSLSGLSDTTITSPSDGQLLKYNATTSKWENVTLSLAISNNVIQLKEGDTVISSVTLPVYNGGVSS